MLTIAQAANDLFDKLGITYASATSQQIQDVMVAINESLQILQTAGQEYFLRTKPSLTITAGIQSYPLDAATQAVLGPVKLANGKPLSVLRTKGQLDQFARIFKGSIAYGAGVGEPEAYYVEFVRNTNSAGDIVGVNLYLAPIPTANSTMVVETVVGAPTVTDVTATTVLPIAQNYTEGLFLPLARYLVSLSSSFSRPDLRDQLQTDYQRATSQLPKAGGFPNVQDPANQEREVTA